MNKVYVSIVCLMTLFLAGCFTKKSPDVVVAPVVIEEPSEQQNGVDEQEPTDEVVVEEDNSDELDENGEFDPAKFEDEDVEEIMKLMNELISE